MSSQQTHLLQHLASHNSDYRTTSSALSTLAQATVKPSKMAPAPPYTADEHSPPVISIVQGDLVINVGRGGGARKLWVSKEFMTTVSPVVRAMLNGKFKEATQALDEKDPLRLSADDPISVRVSLCAIARILLREWNGKSMLQRPIDSPAHWQRCTLPEGAFLTGKVCASMTFCITFSNNSVVTFSFSSISSPIIC